MSILVVQLSDIHFKTGLDMAVSRSGQIAAAIASECSLKVSCIVIAVCGDVGFSGRATEYEVAKSFFDSIEKTLRDRGIRQSIKWIVIPGNHDCNFSGEQDAREALLTSVSQEKLVSKSIADILLAPLAEYFKFAQSFAGNDSAIVRESPFYQKVEVKEGENALIFHLFNTAFLSTIHEQMGSLSFPLSLVSDLRSGIGCSIALLHHPIHWFSQPNVMRPLRDKINEIASIAFVNHEHVSEATVHVPLFGPERNGSPTIYVSGGVIQEDSAPELCSFNIALVDMPMKRAEIVRFEFRESDGQSFFEKTSSGEIDVIAASPNQGPAGFSLSKNFVDFLDDPGAPITHPFRDPRTPIHLSDIFLFPDLWELDEDHDGGDQKQIRSRNVAEEILTSKKVLVTGSEKSGRTSIVKQLYLCAFKAGKIPILIEGDKIPKSLDKLKQTIRTAVKDQYINLNSDAFDQLSPDKKIVLIDDAHRLAPASQNREDFLTHLEQVFGTVILCGDDLIKMDELKGKDARESKFWEYRHMVILPFGEMLREQFVRNWLHLGLEAGIDEGLETEIHRLCATLNLIVKKQLLPAYPLFLLVVLQQTDFSSSSVQGSSFGKLFEGVVTAVLSKTRFPRLSVSDKYHYLAALAKKMFDGKATTLSTIDAREWHNDYWRSIDLSIDFDTLVEDLHDLGVLSYSNEGVRFRYAYFFCFFLAYYLHRRIHDPATRQIVAYLCEHLYHRTSADVVLFLAHLTGDPIVLDEMIKNCDRLFSEIQPAQLGEDVRPINQLGNAVQVITIQGKPDENRLRMRIENDAIVEDRLAAVKKAQDITPPEPESDAIRQLFDIHSGYKTIQILGQAIRNISGSADRETKEAVIGKVFGLSRRILGLYLSAFANGNLGSLIEDMADSYREHQPEISLTSLKDEVCRHLNGLSQFICFALIKHTTFSVGSENLAPTIHRMLGKSSVPIEQLFDLAFDLERPGRFPKDKALQLYGSFKKNHFSGPSGISVDLVESRFWKCRNARQRTLPDNSGP